jgi:hypothetical protein
MLKIGKFWHLMECLTLGEVMSILLTNLMVQSSALSLMEKSYFIVLDNLKDFYLMVME